MPPGRFLVVGEALVDVVVPHDGAPGHAPGGSPLNVAVGLSRLGVPTTLLTEIGEDEAGQLLLRHLRESDVRLAPGSVSERPTSTATARLDGSGAASYDFEVSWELSARDLPDETTALHVGSLGAALRPGRESVLALVDEAVARGLLVGYDPNVRPGLAPDPAHVWRDVREVALRATLVKLSDEDLDFVRPGAKAADVAEELLSGAARLVVVTCGAEGALAFSASGRVEVPSEAGGVVDTVGAGDSFMAALLAVVGEHGLHDLHEERMAAYVAAAHAAAAVTVSRRGADPPWRHELAEDWPGLTARLRLRE